MNNQNQILSNNLHQVKKQFNRSRNWLTFDKFESFCEQKIKKLSAQCGNREVDIIHLKRHKHYYDVCRVAIFEFKHIKKERAVYMWITDDYKIKKAA